MRKSRLKLAAKVFSHCAYYDSLVAQALEAENDFSEICFTIGLEKESGPLRYGGKPSSKSRLVRNCARSLTILGLGVGRNRFKVRSSLITIY